MMSTLNTRETEELREAQSVIQSVLRNGYDPAKVADKDIQMTRMKVNLEKSNKQIGTIVQMKGYYPNG